MRQRASTVTAIEGMSRPVYRIAHELSQNSRSGLTVRFLSKKLDLPIEEVEYLVDVNHSLLYTDLTKIKLVPEGFTAVKRVSDGLENRGDVASLYRIIKTLSAHDFRRLEEQLEIERPGPKKAVVDTLIERYYRHPEGVVEYVATKGFSNTAREVFDIVWQSKPGVLPASKIRAAHGGSEHEVEQALWELFRGLALLEMFRFDGEERLVRHAGILAEIRQWREETAGSGTKKITLKGKKTAPGEIESRGIDFSEDICRLMAAIAAKPARVRGDGELFREDRRRLLEIVPEDAEPSLATCLWAAEGVEWLVRVDNELRAGELERLLDVDGFSRHRQLFDWLMSTGNEPDARRVLTSLLDDLKGGTWYRALDFAKYAMRKDSEDDPPVLKSQGGHHRYVSPAAASKIDKTLVRSLDESLFWLGAVERAVDGDETYFRVTDLGRCLLLRENEEKFGKTFAKRGGEIIVQPNFDIVVPTQDMDPLLTVPLDQFARRQSTGSATVYHLSKDSFTEALQEGHDGDAFVDYLVTHNRGGTLPANVMTTLDDWRGGLRRVRVRTLQVLESDDSLVMAELVHRRKLKKYFDAIDPHKVTAYSGISKAELVKLLEKDGFIVE